MFALRKMSFDPLLISLQIVALQCFHYLAMGTVLGIFHAVFDINVSMDHFFTARFINFTTTTGFLATAAAILTGIAGYVRDSVGTRLSFSYVVLFTLQGVPPLIDRRKGEKMRGLHIHIVSHTHPCVLLLFSG